MYWGMDCYALLEPHLMYQKSETSFYYCFYLYKMQRLNNGCESAQVFTTIHQRLQMGVNFNRETPNEWVWDGFGLSSFFL